MSWLFSRALVEEYSAAIYSGGEPCAQLNVMPTAHPFWRRGKPMDASSLSQSGLTCAVLTERHGRELLMSYLAAFRARTSARQERALESMESDLGYGVSSPESFAKFDHLTSSWKTARPSLLADSMSYSGTWPRSGSMRSGACSPQARSVSSTCAKGSGSLHPTPSGVNGGRNHTMGRIDEWGGSSNRFRGTVIGSMCLPRLEEMVMGWPIGWTELTPFATDKFHAWLQEHGENSAQDCAIEEAA